MSSKLPGDGFSRGQAGMLACLLEAAAPKVGNVHRGADFENLSFTDFLVSAAAIGPVLDSAPQLGVGRTVYDGVAATRALVGTNTNLGMLLLIAPLAAIEDGVGWQGGIESVLQRLTPQDCEDVYRAIRNAEPGGLGKVENMDVNEAPPVSLLDAMRAVAERDLIARQYADGFQLVFETAERLVELRQSGVALSESIVRAHVELIAAHGDSLILRKCGPELALRAQNFAKAVIQAGSAGQEEYHAALADYDFWLRSDGNKRNPGATADLIAASLFVTLRDGRLQPPFR